MAMLLDRISHPQVKVGFNMANSLVAGEDPEAALERLKDRIAHVRAGDVRLAQQGEEPQSGSYVGCVVGLGLVPLAKLFRSLHLLGYDGWFLSLLAWKKPFRTEASLMNLRQYSGRMRICIQGVPGETIEIL